MYTSCPICDSEDIMPSRKKAKTVATHMTARVYHCRNCKHRFIVVTAVASGVLAQKLEDMLDEVH